MVMQLPLTALDTPLGRAIGQAIAAVHNGLCEIVEIRFGMTRVRVSYRQGQTPSVVFL